MKKIGLVLVATVVFLLAACSKNEAPPAADSAAKKTFVVGLDEKFPPMGFRDENNKIVGFDIDLATEVAKVLGYDFTFRPIDWSAKEAELNSKRVDLLWNGLTITAERKEKISFSKPYMNNKQVIIVLASKEINTKADLAGKVIGLQDASSAVQAVESEPEIMNTFKKLSKYPDNVTLLMDLKNGRVDAVVIDEIVGRYYISKEAGKFKVLGEDFGTEEYGVGVRKDDAELLAALDRAIDELKANGVMAEISVKWFGADITK